MDIRSRQEDQYPDIIIHGAKEHIKYTDSDNHSPKSVVFRSIQDQIRTMSNNVEQIKSSIKMTASSSSSSLQSSQSHPPQSFKRGMNDSRKSSNTSSLLKQEDQEQLQEKEHRKHEAEKQKERKIANINVRNTSLRSSSPSIKDRIRAINQENEELRKQRSNTPNPTGISMAIAACSSTSRTVTTIPKL
eukprot:CAMPEP_0194451038 /NCGR_PEP_ID=MMETSP0176-20130528/131076_1 /TAXON_ID=216777 /ORGANISM="Proboscia alata, Strain PI-D3" /LENGTH=188 /DNA_ID=CAMNT_0039278427 /DNA_START=227 /DNA_END=790 /DNA_ORIENTATION=-